MVFPKDHLYNGLWTPRDSMQSFRLKSDVFYQFFPPVDYWTPCKDQSCPFRWAQSPCSNQHETSGVRITTAAGSALQRLPTEGPERTQGPNQIQAAVAYGRKVRPQGGVYDQSLGKKMPRNNGMTCPLASKKLKPPGSVVWSWRFAKQNHWIWQNSDG